MTHLLRDIRAMVPEGGDPPPPVNLQTIEGFVHGWTMLCLVLDMDPQLNWSNIIEPRFYSCTPDELNSYTPLLPRFQLELEQVVIDEVREPEEEPELWMVPIIIEVRRTGTFSRNVTSKYSRGVAPMWPPSVRTGDIRRLNQFFRWGVGAPQPTVHILLAIVGWEKDFTSAYDKEVAFYETVDLVNRALNECDPNVYPSIEDVAQHIEDQLNLKLPGVYPQPEAPPGSRISDDDFVGAAVVTLTAYEHMTRAEKPFRAKLHRQPKPRPKYSAMTVYGKLSFKGLPAF
jgi:hypothetical protein